MQTYTTKQNHISKKYEWIRSEVELAAILNQSRSLEDYQFFFIKLLARAVTNLNTEL